MSTKTLIKQFALAGLLGLAALASQAQPMGRHGGPGAGGPGLLPFGRMEQVLESVDATDAQRTQIHNIMKAAMQDLKAQHEAGRKLHEQGLALFAAPNIDAAAFESLRQQMQAQHEVASKRMTQAMVDAARVLTPEQRAKFAEKMKKRQARMAEHMKARAAGAKAGQ
ncbi:Spy/CpxP family protein refolding chaperone [Pelomonas sp. SE-A7]|uniref:Spy/CpxP family protein refolding chaperone n=1 Tax=Pelomonas sp. SE-A7 TaxID=3054953 RepID=UPI00259CE830|nr:Spy/CpxP family protein refolding chaperone [Pelomonas sp. SE-A7]MDM4765476.1 Spy/CpxP family protein refolding chaperone [Pelomonas sp. SE-A7]